MAKCSDCFLNTRNSMYTSRFSMCILFDHGIRIVDTIFFTCPYFSIRLEKCGNNILAEIMTELCYISRCT